MLRPLKDDRDYYINGLGTQPARFRVGYEVINGMTWPTCRFTINSHVIEIKYNRLYKQYRYSESIDFSIEFNHSQSVWVSDIILAN